MKKTIFLILVTGLLGIIHQSRAEENILGFAVSEYRQIDIISNRMVKTGNLTRYSLMIANPIVRCGYIQGWNSGSCSFFGTWTTGAVGKYGWFAIDLSTSYNMTPPELQLISDCERKALLAKSNPNKYTFAVALHNMDATTSNVTANGNSIQVRANEGPGWFECELVNAN